jgi:hypothetical protein
VTLTEVFALATLALFAAALIGFSVYASHNSQPPRGDRHE